MCDALDSLSQVRSLVIFPGPFSLCQSTEKFHEEIQISGVIGHGAVTLPWELLSVMWKVLTDCPFSHYVSVLEAFHCALRTILKIEMCQIPRLSIPRMAVGSMLCSSFLLRFQGALIGKKVAWTLCLTAEGQDFRQRKTSLHFRQTRNCKKTGSQSWFAGYLCRQVKHLPDLRNPWYSSSICSHDMLMSVDQNLTSAKGISNSDLAKAQ